VTPGPEWYLPLAPDVGARLTPARRRSPDLADFGWINCRQRCGRWTAPQATVRRRASIFSAIRIRATTEPHVCPQTRSPVATAPYGSHG
jgi:hypothetical protein